MTKELRDDILEVLEEYRATLKGEFEGTDGRLVGWAGRAYKHVQSVMDAVRVAKIEQP